jgi:hypothetical protein
MASIIDMISSFYLNERFACFGLPPDARVGSAIQPRPGRSLNASGTKPNAVCRKAMSVPRSISVFP